jgi:octaprenyl-diphosphate synthase
MIHNATLLHDDVIDDGQRRRGQPTINSLWGNESAVLLGDFLLSRALKMCAKLDSEVTKEIAVTAGRVCGGELRQVSESRNWQLSEMEYIDIITEKSASVFSSCCYLGGLLSKGTETQLQSLRCFGLNAGIAFQITDDLLDIIGDERKTGKTLGSDVDKNKLTLPVIHLLKMIDERGKSEIIEKLNAKRGSTELAEVYTLYPNFIEMLESYGSLEYARSRAKEFVEKAIAALADLKESSAKNALIETAKFLASRAV